MKSLKKYLALDFGASNGRTVVGSFDGKKLQMDIVHRFDNYSVSASNTIYWDILYLFLQAKIGIKVASSKYKNLESLAIDTWASDFGLLDSDGKLISNPICYRDESKYIDYRPCYFKKMSKEKLFSITGFNPIYTFIPLFYLYGLKLKNNPGLKIANKFLMIPDILNYFLSGNVLSEYTIASMTTMLNLKTKNWDKEIINTLEIDRNIFPKIVMSGEKVGKLDKVVAEEIGVNRIPIVASASHDTASSILGIPAIHKDRNWAFIGTGTWCIIGIETEKPVIEPKILNYPFLNEGAAEGKNLLAKNLTGFWILQKCREKWTIEKSEAIDWDSLLELALRSKPFKSFIDIDDLQFAQNQYDMPQVIRNYCRETNQKVPEGIGEVARCIYESIVMRLRYDLRILEIISNKKVDIIHLIGGGIRNIPICQWIADNINKVVIAGPIETSSIGNILMQMKAANEIISIEEGREISKKSTEIKYFEPINHKEWDLAFEKYLELIGKNSFCNKGGVEN